MRLPRDFAKLGPRAHPPAHGRGRNAFVTGRRVFGCDPPPLGGSGTCLARTAASAATRQRFCGRSKALHSMRAAQAPIRAHEPPPCARAKRRERVARHGHPARPARTEALPSGGESEAGFASRGQTSVNRELRRPRPRGVAVPPVGHARLTAAARRRAGAAAPGGRRRECAGAHGPQTDPGQKARVAPQALRDTWFHYIQACSPSTIGGGGCPCSVASLGDAQLIISRDFKPSGKSSRESVDSEWTRHRHAVAKYASDPWDPDSSPRLGQPGATPTAAERRTELVYKPQTCKNFVIRQFFAVFSPALARGLGRESSTRTERRTGVSLSPVLARYMILGRALES